VVKKKYSKRTLYIAFGSEKDRNDIHDAISNYLPADCSTEDTPIIEYT